MSQPGSTQNEEEDKDKEPQVLVATLENMSSAIPRPGRYIKIPPISKDPYFNEANKGVNTVPQCKCKVCPELSQKKEKKFDLSSLLVCDLRIDDSDYNIETEDYSDEESEDDSADELPKINLLAILISTVMMLASGQTVQESYLEAICAYLETITDDEGNVPPNIQSLFNHIAKLTDCRLPKMKEKEKEKAKKKAAEKAAQKEKDKEKDKPDTLQVEEMKNAEGLAEATGGADEPTATAVAEAADAPDADQEDA